jgi:tetratricopeptide (TPR) repeat protein
MSITRSRRCAFLLTVVLAAWATTQARGDEYEEALSRGDAAHAALETEKAAAEYQQAYRLAPDRFESLERMAHIHNDLGEAARGQAAEEQFRQATTYAETLQKRFPEKAAAHFWVAASYGNLALFKGGKEKVRLSRDVEKNAKRAVAIDPEFSAAYLVLGIYYREVAELNWFLKAFARTFLGGLPGGTREDSERLLLKAAALSPRDPFIQFQLARTYRSLGRPDVEAKHLQQAIELPPLEPRDLVNRKEAERRFAEIRKDSPRQPVSGADASRSPDDRRSAALPAGTRESAWQPDRGVRSRGGRP